MKEVLDYTTKRFLTMLEEVKDYEMFWPPPSPEELLPGSTDSERLPIRTVASGLYPVRGNRCEVTRRTKAGIISS